MGSGVRSEAEGEDPWTMDLDLEAATQAAEDRLQRSLRVSTSCDITEMDARAVRNHHRKLLSKCHLRHEEST